MSVTIANLALARLGHTRIESLDDDDPAARLVKDLWPAARDEELRLHTWGCATLSVGLPARADGGRKAILSGFARAYPLPADCVRVLQVGPPDQAGGRLGFRLWRIEARDVLSDASPPLALRYVRRLDDAAAMDAGLVACLSLRLAIMMAPRLTGDARLGETLKRDYREAVGAARRVDAIENPPEPLLVQVPWLEGW